MPQRQKPVRDVAILIEPHIPALRRYAWALLRDEAAADDLVQDCLERALSRWQLRRRDGNLRAWLFAILHNRFISDRRRDKRRGMTLPLDEGPEAASPSDSESGVTRRDLLEALALLPEEQRAVVLLVGVEDLSYEDAAQTLGVPIGTVMSRLSRGREKLRRYIEGERPTMLRRVK
jgi:RNA polymerase sigma-70 factor (ECF subfamily)